MLQGSTSCVCAQLQLIIACQGWHLQVQPGSTDVGGLLAARLRSGSQQLQAVAKVAGTIAFGKG